MLVQHYYAAASADDGAAACSLLTSAMASSVPEDYGQSPAPADLRGKTCAEVMSKLFRHPYHLSTADLATTRVIGVRVNGNHGFALLKSKMLRLGEMVVEREGDLWKVGVLIGSVN